MAIFVLVVSIVTIFMFEVAKWREKKGLLQTSGLIQSVCRSDLELILFFSKINKNKKNNHRSTMLLLVIFTISLGRIM